MGGKRMQGMGAALALLLLGLLSAASAVGLADLEVARGGERPRAEKGLSLELEEPLAVAEREAGGSDQEGDAHRKDVSAVGPGEARDGSPEVTASSGTGLHEPDRGGPGEGASGALLPPDGSPAPGVREDTSPVVKDPAREDPREGCPPLPIITFKPRQSLPPRDRDGALEGLVSWLGEHPGVTLIIDGFSDSRGGTYDNFLLGQRRARQVQNRLVRMGLPHGRSRTRSFGEFLPSLEEGVERRVTFSLVGAPGCEDRSRREDP